MSDALHAGARRFSGFADLYDDVRPTPPPELGQVLAAYVGGPVGLVVDLGSGTGLSSRWAATWADEVVGIEPSDDMRAVAQTTRGGANVSSRAGWSHATGLPDGCADVVIAVQSLHWMDPVPTFAEVARLLRPGGVFAAIDCDWPPVVGDVGAELAWERCRRRIGVFEARLAAGATGEDLRRLPTVADVEAAPMRGGEARHGEVGHQGLRSWAKGEHLARMRASGAFVHVRELAMASPSQGTAHRFVELLRSQGDYQTLRRQGLDDELLGLVAFAAEAHARLGQEPRPWWFGYRVRLGVTPHG